MKKLWLLCPFIGLLWSACSNEFDIAAPFKDTPVVYGIISPEDTAHYIRIERVFIDPDASAYDVAKIPDSIYYAENAISVYLERVSNGQRSLMRRIDGNLDGHVRESGTFAETPNWLYKIKPSEIDGGKLMRGEKYKLVIERADGDPTITAETTVPDTLFLISPKPTDIPPQINLGNSGPVTIDWRTSRDASVFDVYINIRFREVAPDGGVVNKILNWKAAQNVIRENNLISGGFYRGQTLISPNDFYNFLLQNVDTLANVERYFTGFDLQIESAGPEIVEYQESQSVNAGLTGAEVATLYTNLSEGFGIFTAKTKWTFNGFGLTPSALVVLNSDARRRNLLKFKG